MVVHLKKSVSSFVYNVEGKQRMLSSSKIKETHLSTTERKTNTCFSSEITAINLMLLYPFKRWSIHFVLAYSWVLRFSGWDKQRIDELLTIGQEYPYNVIWVLLFAVLCTYDSIIPSDYRRANMVPYQNTILVVLSYINLTYQSIKKTITWALRMPLHTKGTVWTVV